MDSTAVIERLTVICGDDYAKTSSLNELYRDVMNEYNFIHDNSSNELYMSLHTELQCVYYESRLGDGDCDDMVFNDCIIILKKIIKELQE
jgi:hypothetical protein